MNLSPMVRCFFFVLLKWKPYNQVDSVLFHSSTVPSGFLQANVLLLLLPVCLYMFIGSARPSCYYLYGQPFESPYDDGEDWRSRWYVVVSRRQQLLTSSAKVHLELQQTTSQMIGFQVAGMYVLAKSISGPSSLTDKRNLYPDLYQIQYLIKVVVSQFGIVSVACYTCDWWYLL